MFFSFEYKDISTLKKTDEGHGIVIVNDKTIYCMSYVGFADGGYYDDSFLPNIPDTRVPKGWQPITVTDACEFSLHSLTHEVLHAIGMEHEQSRGDRGDFIKVDFY